MQASINDHHKFDTSLISGGDQKYFIKVNKIQRKMMQLNQGDPVTITLTPDTSQYGMPLPEEFSEIWQNDKEANPLFHMLTPGHQRNLIYIVNKIKNLDLRI